VLTAPPVVAVPAPVPVAPPLAKPAAPVKYQITIKSMPADAEVFEGVERLGVTPLTLDWKESAVVHNLVVKKKGFKDKPLPVVADRNHDFEFALDSAHHSGSSKPTVVAKPTAPVAAPVAPAEPKAEAKPAGKLRDLKDPFAN